MGASAADQRYAIIEKRLSSVTTGGVVQCERCKHRRTINKGRVCTWCLDHPDILPLDAIRRAYDFIRRLTR